MRTAKGNARATAHPQKRTLKMPFVTVRVPVAEVPATAAAENENVPSAPARSMRVNVMVIAPPGPDAQVAPVAGSVIAPLAPWSASAVPGTTAFTVSAMTSVPFVPTMDSTPATQVAVCTHVDVHRSLSISALIVPRLVGHESEGDEPVPALPTEIAGFAPSQPAWAIAIPANARNTNIRICR